MSTSTNTIAAIDGILTIGVGGAVAWAKKNISVLLKDAEAAREVIANDLAAVQNDIAQIGVDITALSKTVAALAPTPAPAKATPAPKKLVAGK